MKQGTAMLMGLIRPWILAMVLCGSTSVSPSATEEEDPPAIDPRADKLLRRMSSYLGEAPYFSVEAEVWQDVVPDSGLRFQAGRTIRMEVRRPDRLHSEVRSPRRNRAFWYDGKSVTILDRNQNVYGVIAAPDSLDAMLDLVTERFGVAMPLDDLIASKPYVDALKKVSSATYLGSTMVLGVPCQHLAFSQTNLDWQIWIEEGPRAVPRKIVITYNDEEGFPQYTAVLSKWDFETKLPDFVFEFEAPADAQKVDFMELKPSGQRPRSPGSQKEE